MMSDLKERVQRAINDESTNSDPEGEAQAAMNAIADWLEGLYDKKVFNAKDYNSDAPYGFLARYAAKQLQRVEAPLQSA